MSKLTEKLKAFYDAATDKHLVATVHSRPTTKPVEDSFLKNAAAAILTTVVMAGITVAAITINPATPMSPEKRAEAEAILVKLMAAGTAADVANSPEWKKKFGDDKTVIHLRLMGDDKGGNTPLGMEVLPEAPRPR